MIWSGEFLKDQFKKKKRGGGGGFFFFFLKNPMKQNLSYIPPMS